MIDTAGMAERLYGTEPAPADDIPPPIEVARRVLEDHEDPEGAPIHDDEDWHDDSDYSLDQPDVEGDKDEQQPPVQITPEAVRAAIPPEILEQRKTNERVLYGAQAEFAKSIPDSDFRSLEPLAREAVAGELREMAADLGLVPADIPDLTKALNNPPMTEEARISAREQAVALLNQNFGHGAYQAWLDARRFVAADPRRAAILERAGDDPKTVLRIAKLAQQAKVAGRL